MTDKKKSFLYNIFLTFMLSVIIALLGYIGLGIQKNLDNLENKIDSYPTKEYVDRENYYLRAHILESYKQVNEKLDLYIQQNNKIQTYILKNH